MAKKRSDAETEYLWRAYQSAGDFDTVPIEKDTKDVLDEAEEDNCFPSEDIPFNRWLSLCLGSATPDNDNELNALELTANLNELRKKTSTMQRYDIAAAMFNNQLAYDRSLDKRLTTKDVTGYSLKKALKREKKI